MEQSLKHRIILLCGRICSGKSSYGHDGTSRIYVSNIVRHITNSVDRSALQNTFNTDFTTLLIGELFKYLDMDIKHAASKETTHKIIVDGIRERRIVEAILQQYPEAELVWLEVPVEERKRRYENRKDVKDVELFEIADNKPIELECQNIFSTFRDKLTIINNY